MSNELQWRQIALCFQPTMLVGRDHGPARLGNWTVTVLPRTPSALLVTILLGHFLFVVVGFSQSFAQAPLDTGLYSGPYFQIQGLDTTGNPIDALISRLGFSCTTKDRYFNEPCPVERRVAAYVNSLPHNRKEMTEALTALGATCDRDSTRAIDCIYRKRTRNFSWMTGEPTPRVIMDDTFVFHITVEHDNEPFEAKAELERTSERIQ
jgi:hypothetical protein